MAPIHPEALAEQTRIGDEVLKCDDIWLAVEVLANKLGEKVGDHLDTLLCRELTDRERRASGRARDESDF